MAIKTPKKYETPPEEIALESAYKKELRLTVKSTFLNSRP